MTFGVDECRVCGTPIPKRTLTARERPRYAEAIADRKTPLMTEKEWRAAGFKAQPTRWQMAKPADGCCPPCGARLTMRQAHFSRTLVLAVVGLSSTVALIMVTYMLVVR